MIEGLEFGFRVQGFLRVYSQRAGAVRCPGAILQMSTGHLQADFERLV